VSEASELEVDVVTPAAAPLVLPGPPELPAAAVARLPRGELGIPELDADPFWRLVAAFLIECRREQTRRAYFNDLKASSSLTSPWRSAELHATTYLELVVDVVDVGAGWPGVATRVAETVPPAAQAPRSPVDAPLGG